VGIVRGLIVVFAALAACDAGQPSPKQPPSRQAATGVCPKVAETLASFTLGNYAGPEARAPELAKQQAACEKAQITEKEAACLTAAKDEWTAAQCAARLFPHLQVGDGGCKQVTQRLRAAVVAQLGPSASTPQAIQMIDKVLPVIERACVEDGWPQQTKSCILAANINDLKSLERCSETLPEPLRDKLQKRMTDAMPSMTTSP
jgi:hypothetical protein